MKQNLGVIVSQGPVKAFKRKAIKSIKANNFFQVFSPDIIV